MSGVDDPGFPGPAWWSLRLRRRNYELPAEGPTAQERYRSMMDLVLPAFRALGLRGSGGRFQIPSEENWALLGFQKSRWSDRADIQFTVNLMVIPRVVWERLRSEQPYLGAKPSPLFNYGPSAATARVGYLREGADAWWELGPQTDVAALAAAVVADTEVLGLPWMRRQMNS